MLGVNMWKSIRWKFIFIYFLLVFIAMIIVGVFIIQQLEAYYLNEVRDNLEYIKETMTSALENTEDITDNTIEIQSTISAYTQGIEEEIFVIVKDSYAIVASTNEILLNKNASEVLDIDLLLEGFMGKEAEKDIIKGNTRPTKNIVFPVVNSEDEIIGIVYLRADLTNIYLAIDNSKYIFLRATVLALFVTVLLGFLIARSITVPINDVTEKAEKMAQGDFNQRVSVKSDDEIGRLAEMFNFLRDKLDYSLSEISNEKSKLETILKYMADGLIAVDRNNSIIHANSSAKQMFGINESEIPYKSYDDIIGKYNEELLFSKIESSENWEGQVNFEYQNTIYLARYAPYKDESGKNIGIVMIIQDITKRQKVENMQREFVANVSHELKTPLTSIKSYTETLLDGVIYDTEMAKQFLTVVDSESDRMSRLVKDLLQLSRLEYKREKWNKVETNLTPIVRNAIKKIQINAIGKNQQIVFNDRHEEIKAYVDKDRMEQVILNIISNAIKYTQDNGRIDIDIIKINNEARIIVKDNGIGIPKADLPRLFERFYRVDKARSRALGGSGLALSIAREIIKEHEGDIIISSKEGKGTEVQIIIPLNQIQEYEETDER